MQTNDLHAALFTEYIQRDRRADADAYRLRRAARRGRRRNQACAS